MFSCSRRSAITHIIELGCCYYSMVKTKESTRHDNIYNGYHDFASLFRHINYLRFGKMETKFLIAAFAQ
jgi:hypothetical protein